MLGELAALGTAICWSFGSTFFTLSGRIIGSPLVNRTRLFMAMLFAMMIHLVTNGQILPIDAEAWRWGWMGLSGFIGYVLGDAFLFQAFVMIGPRLSMLMMAMAPVFSVILGWVLLDEQLSGQELLGIVLTVIGIAWVVSRDGNSSVELPIRYYIGGILFGLGGALGQAGGLVASKLGLEGDFSALSGNVIRLIIATIVIWAFTTLRGQTPSSIRKLRANPRAFLLMNGGVLAGPVFGVWLSLIAVQHAPVGIASTLMSLAPIFLLPVAYYMFKEKIGMRAVGGTIVAFIGTAILFL